MRILAALLILLLEISCVSFSSSSRESLKEAQKYFVNRDDSRPRQDYIATSMGGMVASAHGEASRIGAQVLQEGGNALDASVAVSFAISVLRPQSTGIGGGGFMLLHNPSQRVLAYDFRERAPHKATKDMYIDTQGQARSFVYEGHEIPDASVNGHLSVGTPGLIAGLLKAHQEHGSLPLERLIRPAIKLAREGFRVYSDLARAIVERQEVLNKFEDSRRIFLPYGSPLSIGQTLIQSDLAWTLERIAKHGAQGFYEGPVSDRLLAEIKAGKGILSRFDLQNYQVKMREPVEGNYRGHRIVAMPPPSSGGVHIIEMLNILSHFDLKSMGHGSTQSLHMLAEAMKRAFADRAKYLGDPDFVSVPTKRLISVGHASGLAEGIALDRATPAHELASIIPSSRAESPTTTHISVVDKNGMAVSTTQTINYSFGSGVVARGTGIVLNDEMDDFSIKPGVPNVYGLVGSESNAVAANKTMLSSMSPTMVFDPFGNLELVVGSPGGPKIINATLQTIINVIDYGMSLPDAVHAFRIHHQWLPDVIHVEANSLNQAQRESLEKMGHELKDVSAIGDVQAIQLIPHQNPRMLIGVSDTRSNGKPY